jgi:hypothetical protein
MLEHTSQVAHKNFIIQSPPECNEKQETESLSQTSEERRLEEGKAANLSFFLLYV